MKAVSLRESNKTDKKQRIQEACRYLFAKQGFDATSTREIAVRAGVGLATLFLYAKDKRDLLFLAANDELEELTAKAFTRVDYEAPLIDRLEDVFGHFFRFFAKNRGFSRDLLRELTFYTSGAQSARFQATRRATMDAIEILVREARNRGTVQSASEDSIIAEVIFYVFAADVRRWLAQDKAPIAAGLAHLRKLLTVVLDGNMPRAKGSSRNR